MIRLQALIRTCTVITSLVITAILASDSVSAGFIKTFGSGLNQFTMDFTTIGSPGNAADTTGSPNPAGAVSYTYQLGTYEVSEAMINKFNASQALQITKDSRGDVNKPATSVSWNEAARFVNWLNTSTGGVAAYKFVPSSVNVNDNIALWSFGDAGYNASNKFRNSLATYFLPSIDEWYKAAYYNPVSSTYFDYSNGSNTAPTAVASGIAPNQAVYGQLFNQGPAVTTLAGGLSPFGVMGLGGNVAEWQETTNDLSNSSVFVVRGIRGGNWNQSSSNLLSTTRSNNTATVSDPLVGFRVASISSSTALVPEPGSFSLVGLALLSGSGWWLKRRKRE